MKYKFRLCGIRDLKGKIVENYENNQFLYPTHEKVFLEASLNAFESKIIAIEDNGEDIAFIPVNFFPYKGILKIVNLDLPFHSTGNNGLDILVELVKFAKKRFLFTNFTFNPIDPNRDIYSEYFKKMKGLERKYVTHIVNGNFTPSKSVNYYIKRANSNSLTIDDNLTNQNIKEFYLNCVNSSRDRKGLPYIETNELNRIIKFYNELHIKQAGKLILIRDRNDTIVSGAFLVYNKNVCVYFHGGNSHAGLKSYAGYLTLFESINFSRTKSRIFDLYGTYKNKDENYDKLYTFKKKWGNEIELSQYLIMKPWLGFIYSLRNILNDQT